MNSLLEKSIGKVNKISCKNIRHFVNTINWENRLIGIKGERGVGKTTLMLQYMKQHLPIDEQSLYVSLDSIYFSGNSLVDLADKFVKNGGKYLFLDEVHRYRTWSQEVKNIYDDYPELKIVLTGSSSLQLKKTGGDLSQRIVFYSLPGLSLREYVEHSTGKKFSSYSLEDILKNHISISREISSEIRPIAFFNEYLRMGYYPYFMEGKKEYYGKLAQAINTVLEIDIPNNYETKFSGIDKIKKLLYVIAVSAPFTPNIQKISDRTGITRNTIVLYLHYLQQAGIIDLLYSKSKGIGILQKPEKIYLHHPNIHYALSGDVSNKGNLRESFFCNQVGVNHNLTTSEKGDFKVDDKSVFEIGGKDKGYNQIADIPSSFVAADDIEIGNNNTIPLWLFGFLY